MKNPLTQIHNTMCNFYLPTQKENGRYIVQDQNGDNVIKSAKDKGLNLYFIRTAVEQGKALKFENGEWSRVDSSFFFEHSQSQPTTSTSQVEEDPSETGDISDFIHNKSWSMKPSELFIDKVKWKYLVRSVIRSQNVLISGPTGSGKTVMVNWLAKALDRPISTFNLGATQDPRSTLIGNTHFDTSRGTYFSQSTFVKAIQEPNSIILLDELSRANPEAFNILMSVLDPNQRYLRIDEQSDTPIVKVHPTVTFIATANIGTEYSSTRVIDRALQDRFVSIKMDYLDEKSEFKLLSKLFPNLSTSNVTFVSKLVSLIREDVSKDEGMLERNLSTRHSIEMASLLHDGFSIEEVLDIVVFPNYSSEGGLESEITYVKQLLQSIVTDKSSDEPIPSVDSNQSL